MWSSCSPDFGVQGVLDRFGQIKPKVLIAADGYYYNGKTIAILDKIGEGGMGVVYKARQVKLDKLFALKLLAPGSMNDPERVARFEREMKAVRARTAISESRISQTPCMTGV